MGVSERKGLQPDERRLAILIRAYPLLWILGLGFLWWAVIAGTYLLRARDASKPRRWLGGYVLVLGLAASLALSLAAAVVVSGAGIPRLLGSALPITVWLGVAAVSRLPLSPDGVYAALRACASLATLQAAIIVVSTQIVDLGTIQTPALRILPDALKTYSGLQGFISPDLAYQGFFSGPITRSDGLMGSAAWSAGFQALVLITMMVRYANRDRSLLLLLQIALCGGALLLSFTRLPIFVTIVATAAIVVNCIAEAWPRHRLIAWYWTIMGVTALSLLVQPWKFVAQLNEARPGSAEVRALSYQSALEDVQASRIFAAFGRGTKEFNADLGFAPGSESTYASLIVRGGFLALVLVTLLLCVLFLVAARSSDVSRIGLLVTGCSAVLMATQDADTGHLLLLPLVLACKCRPGWMPNSRQSQAQAPVDKVASW